MDDEEVRNEFRGIRTGIGELKEILYWLKVGTQRVMARFDDFAAAFGDYQSAVKIKIDTLTSHVDQLTAAAPQPGQNPDLDAAIQRVRQATTDLSSHVDTAPTPPAGGSGDAGGGAGAGTGAAGGQPGTASEAATRGTGEQQGQVTRDTAGNTIGG